MKYFVRKWGNSAAVRLPASAMAAAGLNVDDPVEIREEDGRVVIVPLRPSINIEVLIHGITTENRHDEADWGAPEGREAW